MSVHFEESPSLVNSVCAQPWVGLQVNPFREIRPCCMFDDSLGKYGGAKSLETYFASPQLKLIRENMLKGKWNKGCLSCKSEEILTGSSPRIFSPGFTKSIEMHEVTPQLQKVELFFDNTCNLDCVMCQPRFSTKWNRHIDSLNRLGINFNSFTKEEVSRLQKDDILSLLDQCSEAKNVILIGGEPLASAEANFFLEQWASRGYEGKLEIISNGTLLNEARLDQLSKIKNLVLKLSIDGIERVYEWVRGYQWAGVDNVLKSLNKYPLRALLCPTIGFFNLFNMKDLARYSIENQLDIQLSHVLREPRYLSVGIIPPDLRVGLKEQFQSNQEHYCDVDPFLNILESPVHNDVDLLRKQARKWCGYFDQNRGMMLSEIAPEVSLFLRDHS